MLRFTPIGLAERPTPALCTGSNDPAKHARLEVLSSLVYSTALYVSPCVSVHWRSDPGWGLPVPIIVDGRRLQMAASPKSGQVASERAASLYDCLG